MFISVTLKDHAPEAFAGATSWTISNDGYLNVSSDVILATYAPGVWEAVRLCEDEGPQQDDAAAGDE